MAIYNSYSDFSTKGGGVIEGLGGGRKKGKVGTVYQKVSNLAIKPQYKLVNTVNDINAISSYMKNMNQNNKKLLEDYLILGGVVKMRDSIFVKYTQKGVYEIYSDKIKTVIPKKIKKTKLNKVDKQKQIEEIYQHLLSINHNSNNK